MWAHWRKVAPAERDAAEHILVFERLELTILSFPQ